MTSQMDFRDIAHRYFRGQLADQEYKLLAGLLNDHGNQAIFDGIKKEFEQAPGNNPLVEKNWPRVHYHINRPPQTIPLRQGVAMWKQALAAAAILVIGLLSGVLLSYLTQKTEIPNEQLVFETPRGEKSLVTLPDGSQVWLNANSTLTYNTFLAGKREVELKGEAFFTITHNPEVPFVVRTNECAVEVLGTTFNVMAYDEFGRKEVTLVSGKVNVVAGNVTKTLSPGQALVLKNNKVQVIQADVQQASGWVDNKFVFKDIPLTELIKRLENWYDVDIIFDNRSGKEIHFTGTFKNEETIWQVLDAIRIYLPIRYRKTELRTIKIAVL